jgi:hypothetical protein
MSTNRSADSGNEPDWLALVREKVEGLRFGVVQIVVHDRKVTQIERTEKTRLDSASADASLDGRHTESRTGHPARIITPDSH